MESLHFEVKSGKHGDVARHIRYIMRIGCYSDEEDLIATGHGNMPEFAKDDPRLLWKASDKYERKNGSIFRAYTISLPNPLSIDQLIDLAWDIAEEIAGIKPYQFALHYKLSALRGELHPHMHLTICDRVPDGIGRPPEQVFRRYNTKHPELGGCRKDSGGMTSALLRQRLEDQRRLASEIMNDALARHGHAERIDHRTLVERGIERKPERYLGPARVRLMSEEDRQNFLGQAV